MAYQTRQGKALIEYLQTLGSRHVSAQEIAENLPERIGTATIYRQLEKLVEQGLVQKYVNDGAPACYQYIGGEEGCRTHFHLKCMKCGTLIHLDCDEMNSLSNHILAAHGFLPDPTRSAIYGTCGDCLKKAAAQ